MKEICTFLRRIRKFPLQSGTILIILVGILTGCTPFSVHAPEGFAEVGKSERGVFQSVSPEGMKFTIRTIETEFNKDLDFWMEALLHHLEKEGYQSVGGPTQFETDGGTGTLMEWGVPYQGKDYLFMTALLKTKKGILLSEAAGEVAIYNKYREDIIKSLETITID